MGMISTGKNLDSKNNSDDFRQFQDMLSLTKEKLQRDNPNGYQKFQGEFWKRFEIDVCHSMKKACFDLNIDWNIEYLGGHKFPDIIARINQQRSFGVEVKTLSQSNENWNVMGGSIMETTAEKDVSRIHVFCAKKNPFEIKYRPFEDCVKDVAITHSPRYMLDLEMPSEQCLFKKIHKSYSEVRTLDNPFSAFREYLQFEKRRKGSDNFWWQEPTVLSSEQDSQEVRFASQIENSRIRFWSELENDKKHFLKIRMIILFPEIINGDYRNAAKWLCQRLIINSSLRDSFSAGGKKAINGILVPKIIANIDEWKEDIAKVFKYEYTTLEYRYPVSNKGKSAWENWRKEIVPANIQPEARRVLCAILEEIGAKI